MNLDTMLILKVLGYLQPFEAVVISCNCTPERSEDPLDKAVDNVKAYSDEVRGKVVAGVQKESQKQLDSVEKKLRMETNSIKNLVKKEVEGDKDNMDEQMRGLKRLLQASFEDEQRQMNEQLLQTRDHLKQEM